MRPIRRHMVVLCLALAAAVPSASAQSAADEQLVQNGYPVDLINDFYRFADPDLSPPDSMYAFERADLDGIGSANYIVAVYGNTRAGRIRVYKPSSGSAPLAESTLREIGGSNPTVTLLDLDGDGKPEIIARYQRMHGTAVWLYKWSAGQLVLFGPMSTDSFGQQHSTLASPVFDDLDGDGIPEIIMGAGPHDEDPVLTVLTLRGGKYVPTEPSLFYAVYKRGEGDPEEFEDSVVTTKPGTYLIRIANGDGRGDNAITSAEVKVNGKQVFGPSSFQQKTRLLSASVQLGASNLLEVSIAAKPGTQMTISVVRAK